MGAVILSPIIVVVSLLSHQIQPIEAQSAIPKVSASTPAPQFPTLPHNEPKELTTQELICKYFGDECRLATAVFTAESGLRADAVGDTNTPYPSCGIAQIRILPTRGITCDEMKQKEHNIEYAKYLRDKAGWRAWSAFKNQSYKRYY